MGTLCLTAAEEAGKPKGRKRGAANGLPQPSPIKVKAPPSGPKRNKPSAKAKPTPKATSPSPSPPPVIPYPKQQQQQQQQQVSQPEARSDPQPAHRPAPEPRPAAKAKEGKAAPAPEVEQSRAGRQEGTASPVGNGNGDGGGGPLLVSGSGGGSVAVPVPVKRDGRSKVVEDRPSLPRMVGPPITTLSGHQPLFAQGIVSNGMFFSSLITSPCPTHDSPAHSSNGGAGGGGGGGGGGVTTEQQFQLALEEVDLLLEKAGSSKRQLVSVRVYVSATQSVIGLGPTYNSWLARGNVNPLHVPALTFVGALEASLKQVGVEFVAQLLT
ncbi:MAG: hypothetical protein WDW36_004471 [Sanguina aurantia]